MKYLNKIKYLIFTIGMIVNVNIYGQGDALSIVQKCDPSKLDLTIDGGFAPYEVEWQALVNGTWQTVTGWPKTDLSGSDGQEDFTSTLNYEEYKVIVHDNLCGVVEKEIVTSCCAMSIQIVQISHAVCGQAGSVDVSISGANPNLPLWYDYYKFTNGSWQLFVPSQPSHLSPINKGFYKVVARNGPCTAEKTFQILSEDEIEGHINIIVPVTSCTPNPFVYNGYYTSSMDGILCIDLDVDIEGDYDIIWSNGSIGACQYNLGAGTYSVKLVFPSGCEIPIGDVVLCRCDNTTNYPQASGIPFCTSQGASYLQITGADVIPAQSGVGGSITVHTTPGFTPEFFWSPSVGNQATVSNLSPGTYCVTVSDICESSSDSECYVIVDCAIVNINVNGSVTNTCTGYNVGTISTLVSGGQAPYSYQWNTGATSSSVSNLSTGQHCITVTDANGCIKLACFNVGLNQSQTYRNGCVFSTYCNGVLVEQNNIGSYDVVNSSDCRYVDTYCNDGVYLGSNFWGTTHHIVSNCRVDERCNYNGQLYQTHQGQVTTEFIGFGLDRESDCWWCHTATYCFFPSLNWINPNSISLFSHFEHSFILPSPSCATGVCLSRVFCNGVFMREFCDPDCVEFACGRNDLRVKYETEEETLVNDNGEIEVLTKYKVVSFDTLKVAQFLKDNRIQELNLDTDIRSKTTDIENDAVLNKVKMYPNPAFDYLNFEFDLSAFNETSSYRITLYNSLGQNVKSSLVNLNNDKLYQMPIHEFSSGLYKIVISEDGSGIQIYQSTIAKI